MWSKVTRGKSSRALLTTNVGRHVGESYVSGANNSGVCCRFPMWLWATALHFAVSNNQAETAQLLISRGINVNAKTIHGLTPLHFAAEGGKPDMIALLLKNGADTAATDDAGNTSLQMAQSKNQTAAVAMLAENMAKK